LAWLGLAWLGLAWLGLALGFKVFNLPCNGFYLLSHISFKKRPRESSRNLHSIKTYTDVEA